MANPFSGVISSAFKGTFDNAIDALLMDDALTRPCKLIYQGSAIEVCDNCSFDPIGRKSSNRYKAGGPIPFPAGGICPSCGGAGMKTAETTETVRLLVTWDNKGWKDLGARGLPDGMQQQPFTPNQFAQTMSGLSTWPKINRANEIVLDTDVENYIEMRCMKKGDAELCGMGTSRYVLAMWERI